MRKILFRAKRKDTGGWIEGFYACESNHTCIYAELKYRHYIYKDVCLDFGLGGLVDFEVIPETVGQYTELTDKNGVKIFEGDIVSISKEDERGVVRWEDGDAAYVIGCDDNVYLLSFLVTLWERDIEVIGNIHDNPELMEVVK